MSVTKTALIITYGFFGDIMFASSIAKRFIEDKQYDAVDYLIGFPQMRKLMENNPYIRNVYVSSIPGPSPVFSPDALENTYDRVIQLGPFDFTEPPPAQVKRQAGCVNIDTEFEIYVSDEANDYVRSMFDKLDQSGVPIVAIMNNWQPKAFSFTETEYWRGVDVPYKGYGGKLRDIPKIVDALRERYVVVTVGMPDGVSQFDTLSNVGSISSLELDAALLKNADVFVGAEGGLANLAAGVGCPTILDSSFVWQLYGPNGVIRKIKPEPQLGPRFYFPDVGHIDLSPYLTDDELIEQLITHIDKYEHV